MRKSSMARRSLSAIGMLAGSLAISVLLPLKALAKDYTQLNIFGDSLVDAGNLFNISNGTFPLSPPYAGKSSNGPVWVEQLGAELGITPVLSSVVVPALSVGAALPPADGINFALTGSLSSDVNVGGPQLPGLQQQIAAFVAIAAATPPAVLANTDALSILLAGGNDYNQALRDLTPADALSALPEQVTNNLVGAVTALADAGAKHILVSNLPDLSLQPFADSLDALNPVSSSLLASLTEAHNQLLSEKLTALAAGSDAEIIQFNLASLADEVVAMPTEFGLTNTDDACLTNFQLSGAFEGVCDNPDAFFFWDDVHPTTAAHGLIAQAALASLNIANPTDSPVAASVPEPSGILGLLAVSGTLIRYSRTRRR